METSVKALSWGTGVVVNWFGVASHGRSIIDKCASLPSTEVHSAVSGTAILATSVRCTLRLTTALCNG
ncbi:MAG: hypothetical protein ACKER6_01365 [Candidatus Hodgkinia cicadicola]